MEQENTFYIDFNTKNNPGKLEAVKITIEMETITDMERKLNVALCDHPLYKELARYVKANPPR